MPSSSTLNFKPETLGHLIADRWLTVPPYQRGYAWEAEQVEEFWTDLEGALTQQCEYFVGAIVVTKDGPAFQIIDGQQRLATTSLLFAAIRDELTTIANAPLQQHVEQTYLRTFDRRSNSQQPRLQIASADIDFYTNRFLLRSGGDAETPSQKRLVQAFEFLRGKVAGIKEGEEADVRAAAMNGWIDHLEQSVVVILVETPSEADAFRIFETLNDRGATLTIADLLKNYLMTLAKADAKKFAVSWNEAEVTLGAEFDTLEFVTFLRHLWNSRVGATRERDLYASIRRTIDSAERANDLVADIAKSASGYAALLDPAHGLWADAPDAASRAIETLVYLQLGQYRPLLLAGLSAFDINAATRLAVALVSWSFRGLIFGGIGGGTAERVYASAAVAVRSGRASSLDDVFSIVRQIVPTDDDFRNAFERAAIRRVRIGNYIMRALERSLAGDATPALEPFPPMKQPLVFGRVVPRKLESSWPRFAPEDADRHAFQIGNFLLQPPGKFGPSEPTQRLTWATSLGPKVNEGIGSIEKWSPDAIRHRQQDMAARALIVWPREP